MALSAVPVTVVREHLAEFPPGDPENLIWLGLNPQGQVFLEGLTAMDLTGPFCDFLLNEVRAGRRRTVAPLDHLIAFASTEKTCPA